jgi:LacI family transcriptional regulator
MVRHLVDQGCRRIVHISGPAGNVDAQERSAGYRAAMAEAGLGDGADVLAGDFTEEAGAAAAQALLARDELPDAIYAANDAMAIGCLLALREAGVHAPDQVAMAGFDDIPAARYVSPALTTLRVDIAAIGERAVAMLVATMRGGDAVVERLMPQLMTRATTLRTKTGGTDQ